MSCILKHTREEAEVIEGWKQRKLDEKRVDSKILAEEIVKLLKEQPNA